MKNQNSEFIRNKILTAKIEKDFHEQKAKKLEDYIKCLEKIEKTYVARYVNKDGIDSVIMPYEMFKSLIAVHFNIRMAHQLLLSGSDLSAETRAAINLVTDIEKNSHIPFADLMDLKSFN